MTRQRHMTRRRDTVLVRACSRHRFTDSPVLKMFKRSSSHAPMRPLSVARRGVDQPSLITPASVIKRSLKNRPGRLSLPSSVSGLISSFNATATHCTHSNRTPRGVPAGGSTNAGAIDHVITGTACTADLRDHAVRLMKRHGRHGLRRCCDG